MPDQVDISKKFMRNIFSGIKIQICFKLFFVFFQTSGLPEEWEGKTLNVILDLGQFQKHHIYTVHIQSLP